MSECACLRRAISRLAEPLFTDLSFCPRLADFSRLPTISLDTIDHTSEAKGKRTFRYVDSDDVYELAVRVHGGVEAHEELLAKSRSRSKKRKA